MINLPFLTLNLKKLLKAKQINSITKCYADVIVIVIQNCLIGTYIQRHREQQQQRFFCFGWVSDKKSIMIELYLGIVKNYVMSYDITWLITFKMYLKVTILF